MKSVKKSTPEYNSPWTFLQMVISIGLLQLIYQRLCEALQSHVSTWLRKLAEKSNLGVWGKEVLMTILIGEGLVKFIL